MVRPAADRRRRVRLDPPLLCLVTDRHRLSARIGSPPDADRTTDALLTQTTAAAEAGVRLIQIREPDLPSGALVGLVRAIRAAVARHGTLVVVNDRLDVALAAAADGVHLKAASVPVIDAARIAPPQWLIGRSVHCLTDIAHRDTAGAHYLIVGTVFPTASKPAGWQTVGLSGLEAAVRAASPVPVLGIGGIGPTEAAEVGRTGAAGVAAVDAFLPTDRARIADTVHEGVLRMRIAFDSTYPLS